MLSGLWYLVALVATFEKPLALFIDNYYVTPTN